MTTPQLLQRPMGPDLPHRRASAKRRSAWRLALALLTMIGVADCSATAPQVPQKPRTPDGLPDTDDEDEDDHK